MSYKIYYDFPVIRFYSSSLSKNSFVVVVYYDYCIRNSLFSSLKTIILILTRKNVYKTCYQSHDNDFNNKVCFNRF